MSSAGARWVQGLVAVFLAVLFLQSGLDKVLDWKGNRESTAAFFAKSPLRRLATLLLGVLALLEVLTGVVAAAGALAALLLGLTAPVAAAEALAAVTLLSVFFGQRLAKDYAGAAGTVPYFLVTLFGLAVAFADQRGW